MDIEKLYQDVWAQVFAAVWVRGNPSQYGLATDASEEAHYAAFCSVDKWKHDTARAAIAAKAKQDVG